MIVSLTVGKVDAGVAVLLTEDKRLIEFPSILLPPDIQSGSIVDVEVSRNLSAETETAQKFEQLQSAILEAFGSREPSTPALRCRNATQTSVVLEWDPLDLATAELRSFSLYRNGSKAGSIPRPKEMTSTKISGLAVDTEYTFQLVLKTSAGTFSSERLAVRTHKMTNLSGITVTPGTMPPPLRESLEQTVERIGAKLIEQVRIDTTHFVSTEEKGEAFKKAQEMNIPVVVPDWILGCEREGRIVGVTKYYIGADPKLRQVGTSVNAQREPSIASTETRRSQPVISSATSTTPTAVNGASESSEDAEDDDRDQRQARPAVPPKSTTPNSGQRDAIVERRVEPEAEDEDEEDDEQLEADDMEEEEANDHEADEAVTHGKTTVAAHSNGKDRDNLEEAMEDVKL